MITESNPSSRTLSKSDFLLARSCDAKLFYRENGYPDTRGTNAYLELLRYGGFMVEALARAQRPGGILVDSGRGAAADFERTQELLQRDEVTLFQATLLAGRRLVRADIIEKRGNNVRLVEVKAKSFDGQAHFADLRAGGAGVFRGKRRPHPLIEKWQDKFEDLTFQALVLEQLMPGLTVHPALLLVDKSKRSALDNVPSLFEIVVRDGADGRSRAHSAEFVGTADDLVGLDLLTEVDAAAEVAQLRAEVDGAAAHFETLLDAPFVPAMAIRGAKCAECEFRVEGTGEESGFAHCWGDLARVEPHALELFSIGTVKDVSGTPLIESLVDSGKASLFDIPDDRLVRKDGTRGSQAERQLRQIHHMRSGERWVGPQLRSNVEALMGPLHFVDFEASRLALPYHANMRTYGQVAFQWSCHRLGSAGEVPQHQEWLNGADEWPNMTFARGLRAAIGDTDTVLTWSSFESSSLNEIVREHPNFVPYDAELAGWVDHLVNNRIVDLYKWACNDFYHPGMRGKASIKAVLDALWRSDPVMREQFTTWTGETARESVDPYHALPALIIAGVQQDVREGTGAVRAYEAMMYGDEKRDDDAKAKWRALLLRYCKLDTLSMVLIFEYWRRAIGP